jgi:division protein CdvB (Snf7/Vps24/ESCRT-III family)
MMETLGFRFSVFYNFLVLSLIMKAHPSAVCTKHSVINPSLEMTNLSHKILNNWDGGSRGPLFSRIDERLHIHHAPLKEKIATSIYRLKAQENKLEASASRMMHQDRDLFSKVVAAQLGHDQARAAMYANECAEVRKMAKTVLRCQLALEQVNLRLETIEEFGDVAAMMAPVAGVVHSIKSQISGLMPEVGFELSEISETLSGIVVDAGEATGEMYDSETPNAEAQRILSEASTISEQRMREKFPDLPATAPTVPQRDAESFLR